MQNQSVYQPAKSTASKQSVYSPENPRSCAGSTLRSRPRPAADQIITELRPEEQSKAGRTLLMEKKEPKSDVFISSPFPVPPPPPPQTLPYGALYKTAATTSTPPPFGTGMHQTTFVRVVASWRGTERKKKLDAPLETCLSDKMTSSPLVSNTPGPVIH